MRYQIEKISGDTIRRQGCRSFPEGHRTPAPVNSLHLVKASQSGTGRLLYSYATFVVSTLQCKMRKGDPSSLKATILSVIKT